MRRVFLIMAAASLFATSAVAQTVRPNLYAMTCASASALVNARGAVVGNTGPGLFERIVSSGGFCYRNEEAIPYFSRSRDVAQCMVGYECRDIGNWDTDNE
jgi:hypothetical protein